MNPKQFLCIYLCACRCVYLFVWVMFVCVFSMCRCVCVCMCLRVDKGRRGHRGGMNVEDSGEQIVWSPKCLVEEFGL